MVNKIKVSDVVKIDSAKVKILENSISRRPQVTTQNVRKELKKGSCGKE